MNFAIKERAETTGTAGTAGRFIITMMILCFAVVSFVSFVPVVSKKIPPQAPQPNFLGESAVKWVTMGYYKLL